jgi:two-component system OmpR family response regulator/two-component system response regulator RstA
MNDFSAKTELAEPMESSTKHTTNCSSVSIALNLVSRPCLLLVCDNATLTSTFEYLVKNDLDVQLEPCGDRVATRLWEETFDVVLLDIGLPGRGVFAVCREVRQQFAGPIIVLSTQDNELDEVEAFEHGADDYFSKLHHQRALLARLQMRLRQAAAQRHAAAEEHLASEFIEVNGLYIDASNRTVQLHDQTIELSDAEFELLWLLASYPGRVLERQWLYEELQGMPYNGQDRSVDLRISRLRKKLADDSSRPKRIKSVHGVGYMLATETHNDAK